MQSLLWIVLVAFSFTFLGCSQNSDQSNSLQDIHSNKNQSIPKTEVRVDLLDTAKWQEIKSLNKGKVLFVNIWATWCLPCKEEFPDLVKLAEEYQNSDVVIVGVSVDYQDEIVSKIIPFLQSQKARFPNYVQNFKQPEVLINMFNEKWRGAVPATFIYDQNGIQKAFLLGKKSYEEFKTAIEKIRDVS